MKNHNSRQQHPRAMALSQSSLRRARGFNLLELMMAMALGLLVMVGLVSSFVSASRANRSVQQDSEQIENGRMAIDMITQDVKMAGYFNSYYLLPSLNGVVATPTALSDPCLVAPITGAATADNLTSAMAFHVQVYNAPPPVSAVLQKPMLTAAGANTSCGGLLAASNLVAGSDVLVVRRASTKKVSVATDIKPGVIYLQTGAFMGELMAGATMTTLVDKRADSAVITANLQIRDGAAAVVAGDIYRYITNIYFVAPCAVGNGTGGACTSSDDTTPTLKRLELRASTTTAQFQLVSLVENIQSISFDSGIDNAPSLVSTATGFIGDGQPDEFKRDGHAGQSLSQADRANTVALNIYVLARNSGLQMDYTDSKSYILTDNRVTGAGSTMTQGPFSDHYRRHVYAARVSIDNWAQRRENP